MSVEDYMKVIHHLNECLYDDYLKFALIGVSEVALMDRKHGSLTATEFKMINDVVSKYEYQDKEERY